MNIADESNQVSQALTQVLMDSYRDNPKVQADLGPYWRECVGNRSVHKPVSVKALADFALKLKAFADYEREFPDDSVFDPQEEKAHRGYEAGRAWVEKVNRNSDTPEDDILKVCNEIESWETYEDMHNGCALMLINSIESNIREDFRMSPVLMNSKMNDYAMSFLSGFIGALRN